MLNLDSYLENFDAHIMTTTDSLQDKYINTPMNEEELKKYEKIKPLLQKLISLQDEVNKKAFELYGDEKTFTVSCAIHEPYRKEE